MSPSTQRSSIDLHLRLRRNKRHKKFRGQTTLAPDSQLRISCHGSLTPKLFGPWLLPGWRVRSASGNCSTQAQEESRAILQNEISADSLVRSFLRLITLNCQFGPDWNRVLGDAETDQRIRA